MELKRRQCCQHCQRARLTPESILQENGSLLLAQTPAEVASLQQRAKLLGKHDTQSRFMDAAELRSVEPAVVLPPEGGGLLVECDAQLVRGALRRVREYGVLGGLHVSRA